MKGRIPFHPLANLFPLIEGAEFEALCADIAENGLRNNILIWRGAILDGRNRYRALLNLMPFPDHATADNLIEAGLAEDVSSLSAGALAAQVISLNLHRRHLDETQRALVAAKLSSLSGESANLRSDTPPPGVRIDEAARLLNVSPRSVDTARSLIREAPPAVLAAAQSGAVSLHAAHGGLRAARDAVRRDGVPVTEAALQAAYDRLRQAQEEQRTAAKARKKADRAAREARLAGKIAASNAALAAETKRYGVIYADPEWQFGTWGEGGMDRAPENHYPTSPTEAIAARPVGALAAQDCVLFLWATQPMLPDALAVMAGWGFTYKSHTIWRKVHESDLLNHPDRAPRLDLGTGYWFRNGHELLLVGTRGDVPAPAMGDQFPSVIDAPVGRHSEKPEAFHALIEAYFPTLPKLELNARAARPGWDCWGAEAPEAGAVPSSFSEVPHA